MRAFDFFQLLKKNMFNGTPIKWDQFIVLLILKMFKNLNCSMGLINSEKLSLTI